MREMRKMRKVRKVDTVNSLTLDIQRKRGDFAALVQAVDADRDADDDDGNDTRDGPDFGTNRDVVDSDDERQHDTGYQKGNDQDSIQELPDAGVLVVLLERHYCSDYTGNPCDPLCL